MRVPRQSAADAARRIADALREAGYRHAIGGALALGVAGVPRGTQDVDVNVFVTEDALPDVIAVLQKLGIALRTDDAILAAASEGMFVGDWDGMRIGVFVPSIPFSDDAERTRVVVSVGEWEGTFLSPETIAVFKMLFFRLKDRVDLERLIAVRGDRLDHAYVRRWLVDMMGEDDERVTAGTPWCARRVRQLGRVRAEAPRRAYVALGACTAGHLPLGTFDRALGKLDGAVNV